MISNTELPSTRPYLIRALYDWCSENGFTPYVAVKVDNSVQVPREYVQGGEIVLNVSMDATSSLKLGNDFIEFKARFGGQARDIMVPVSRVMAVYARENGQGMAFPVSDEEVLASSPLSSVDSPDGVVGEDDAPVLGRGDAGRGAAEIAAAAQAHLDENQCLAVAADEVDLLAAVAGIPPVARDDLLDLHAQCTWRKLPRDMAR